MPPRNPSELARLEEERQHLREEISAVHTKVGKEEMLRELRKIEGILGVESVPYNSEEF